MGIKKVVQAWNSVSLVKRIVIGLVIGGVLGVAVPNIEVVELLGTLFVSALKGGAVHRRRFWCSSWLSARLRTLAQPDR